MMAYFARDEVAPQEDSCDAELALHARLSAEPFAAVSEEELDAIKDRDVVHNYRAVLAFRDFLAQHATLESAYLAVVRGAPVNFPPLFLEQMTQIILRSILDGETDTMKLRAAECLFRFQTVTLDDGRIMVADHATVQLQAGMARMLQEGETLDLEFHDAAGADRALHASGYYVPVGAAPDARVGPADHSDSP